MTDPAESTLRLRPEGMTCASCVARVERVLKAQPGVSAARVNLADESADIRFAAPAEPAALAGALAKAGYPVRQATLTLSVEGMTCASCTGRVERVLKAQPGVVDATANLAARRAQITVWEGATTAEKLAEVVSRAGFAATPPEEAAPDARAREYAALKRDGWIAGLLTLPVFLTEMGGHAVPAFHHWLMGLMPQQMLWIAQFVLATLVLVFPGRRFFAKGIPALLRGGPDMNSLVAVGTAAAWCARSISRRRR
jgi:Cu+-exporting ATPase